MSFDFYTEVIPKDELRPGEMEFDAEKDEWLGRLCLVDRLIHGASEETPESVARIIRRGHRLKPMSLESILDYWNVRLLSYALPPCPPLSVTPKFDRVFLSDAFNAFDRGRLIRLGWEGLFSASGLDFEQFETDARSKGHVYSIDDGLGPGQTSIPSRTADRYPSAFRDSRLKWNQPAFRTFGQETSFGPYLLHFRDLKSEADEALSRGARRN